jgi:hypothetical protein
MVLHIVWDLMIFFSLLYCFVSHGSSYCLVIHVPLLCLVAHSPSYCLIILCQVCIFLQGSRFSTSFILLGRKEKEERKEEKRNLSKKRKRHINNNKLVKHWFPLSFYCLVLQSNLVLFPEMSASQPFRKGFGDVSFC